MKILSCFQSFGFTRNETKVILLLSATFLVGLGIRYYNSNTISQQPAGKAFDYSIPDSIFAARSAHPYQTPSPKSDQKDSSNGKPAPKSLVNINTATKTDLMRLPGIGPAYAERIISYRQDNGPFQSVGDLRKVKGIGVKKLERLRPFVLLK